MLWGGICGSWIAHFTCTMYIYYENGVQFILDETESAKYVWKMCKLIICYVCKILRLLKVWRKAGRLQLIQNLAPFVALGRQYCIRIVFFRNNLCTCYNAKNFEKSYRNKVFSRMYQILNFPILIVME